MNKDQKRNPLIRACRDTLIDKILNTITVKDLPKLLPSKSSKEVIFIESNTSIAEALEILSKNNLLSVPVRDHQDKFWMGFIDVLDIVHFIIEMYTEGQQVREEHWGSFCKDIQTLTHRGIRFGIKPVSAIINESGVNGFKPIYETGTLYQLIEDVFAKRIHRAPVVSPSNNILQIVSQSDIIQILAQKIDVLADWGSLTIEQTGLGNRRDVISIPTTAPALHALYLMCLHKVQAVAIVLPNGTLIGNFSASDIRGLAPEKFSSLLLPVTDYLRETNQSVKPPATVTLSSTLTTVILKLATYRVHRLWIVNDKDKPIGVMSLTDIMAFLSTLAAA